MKTKRKHILWALAGLALAVALCRIFFFSEKPGVPVPLSGDEAAAVLSIDRAEKPGENMSCLEYRGVEPFDIRRAVKDFTYLKGRLKQMFGAKGSLLVTGNASLTDLAAGLSICGNAKGVIVPYSSGRIIPTLPWHGGGEVTNGEGSGAQVRSPFITAAAQKVGPFDSRHYSMQWKAARAIRKLLTDAGWCFARLTDGKVVIVSAADLELLRLASSPTDMEQLLKDYNQPKSPSAKEAAGQLLSILWRAGMLSDSIMSSLAPDHFPGQLGRWKFNEGSGRVVKDSSGPLQGNDGTWFVTRLADGTHVDEPTWVTGRKDSALHFEEQQMVILGNEFQRSYDGITVSCWIKHGKSFWQSIVERSNWDNPDGIGLWADWHGSNVSFGHYLSGYVQSRAVVQDDQWHFVLGTMSRGAGGYIYRIYVDGKFDNSATNAVGLTSTSKPWTVGSRYDHTWGYRGEVEDVRIFNRALSESEVEKLYHD